MTLFIVHSRGQLFYIIFVFVEVPHEDALETQEITSYHLRLIASVVLFILFGILNRVFHVYHYSKRIGGSLSFAIRIAPVVEVPWLMAALGK